MYRFIKPSDRVLVNAYDVVKPLPLKFPWYYYYSGHLPEQAGLLILEHHGVTFARQASLANWRAFNELESSES
jgi:hypothetical protein